MSQRSEARADPERPQSAPPVAPREHHGLEVLAVLGVSLGMSGLYALLYLIRAEITVTGGIKNTTACVVCEKATVYPWLDFADHAADLLSGLMPAFLALVLLSRNPGGLGFGIGFDLRARWRDLGQGVGFLAVIGIPGLALVWAAHRFGFNASLNVVTFPDVWYRIPYLLLSAFQNGLAEEVIVAAFLLTRLRQMGWSNQRALFASAALRGSYHLYQGYGGFLGNLVMGLVFGYWFQRTRRVLPLVIAHFLLDAVSFIGYLYLHDRISWI